MNNAPRLITSGSSGLTHIVINYPIVRIPTRGEQLSRIVVTHNCAVYLGDEGSVEVK